MARTDPVGWCQVTTELVILTRDESERRSSAQKQHGPPFEGSPRLALRTPKSLLSCGAQKDPPKEEIVRPLFGGPNCPRRLCSSSLRQFSHSPVGLEPGWSMVPCGTASGEPASMTDQKPALNSAGQPGPVELTLPSFTSSLLGVIRGTWLTAGRCPIPRLKK